MKISLSNIEVFMSSFKRHLCYLIMTFIKMISRDTDHLLLWHVAPLAVQQRISGNLDLSLIAVFLLHFFS